VAVAEKYYVGTIRGIPASARDLETAMQITDQLDRIVEAARPTGTCASEADRVGSTKVETARAALTAGPVGQGDVRRRGYDSAGDRQAPRGAGDAAAMAPAARSAGTAAPARGGLARIP